MIKKIIYSISLIIYFLMFSCSEKEKSVVAIDFSGTYIFSQAPSKDTLFIKSDSTYQHKFWSPNGEVYEVVGSWNYDPKIEEILFKKFIFFNDLGPVTPPGNWYSRVRFSNGNIDLIYSRENDIYFRKSE